MSAARGSPAGTAPRARRGCRSPPAAARETAPAAGRGSRRSRARRSSSSGRAPARRRSSASRPPVSLSVQRSTLPVADVERVDVGRRSRVPRDVKPRSRAVWCQRRPLSDAGRQRRDRALAAGRRVEQVQRSTSVLVGDEGDRAPVVGQRRTRRRPRRCPVVREVTPAASPGPCSASRWNSESLSVVTIDGSPVAGELARRRSDLGRRRRPGRQRGLRPGGDVDEPEVALVDREVLLDAGACVSSGDQSSDAPAAALRPRAAAGRSSDPRVHHVDVAVVAVAPGRGVGDAGRRRWTTPMPPLLRLAVGEQGDAAAGEVVAVDLEELVAAHVLEKEKVAPGPRLIDGLGDRLLGEGELAFGPRPARQPGGSEACCRSGC